MVVLRLSPWVGPSTVFWTSMSIWCSSYVYLVFVASSLSSSSSSPPSISSSSKSTTTKESTTTPPQKTSTRWNSFATCPIPHDVHSVVTVVLATLSLWNVLDEYFPTQFSMAYFVLDLADCLARRRWMFVVHAGLTLGLMSLCFAYPLLYQSKLISCGLLTEFSTPFLHYWNNTRSKWHFWCFVAAFTACRILWIPYMWRRGSAAVGFYDADSWRETPFLIPTVTFLFYGLQVAWWCKMLLMLWDYKEPSTTTTNVAPKSNKALAEEEASGSFHKKRPTRRMTSHVQADVPTTTLAQ